MKIGLRLLLGYFLVVGLAAWFLMRVFAEEVKPGVRAALEDTLVDTAQLLAELVAEDVYAGRFKEAELLLRMQRFAQRSIDVNISGVHKQSMDYRVYITDLRGIVMFDSESRAVGQDYSRWNDVYLTLRGRYGARSTRANPADDASSVMHVAAPVRYQGRIIGVLTVAKPIATITPFIERSQQKIRQRGFLLLLISLAIGIGFTFWLSRALLRLQKYAQAVELGEKVVLPPLAADEIGSLGRSLEAMRIKLEGRQYVEQLMHTLAHELKSPIAAIQGAAELLQEEMPPADRQRFLQNIIEQNQRQKQLIDRLLALIKLEKQQQLDHRERILPANLLDQLKQDFASLMQQRQLHWQVELPESVADLRISGDALLLRQALGNLLANACDFAPADTTITCRLGRQGDWLEICIEDQGPGIPEYAQARIFERFYSLPRAFGEKSTGLGLPFAREVALLHGGSLRVENRAGGGVAACLSLPL